MVSSARTWLLLHMYGAADAVHASHHVEDWTVCCCQLPHGVPHLSLYNSMCTPIAHSGYKQDPFQHDRTHCLNHTEHNVNSRLAGSFSSGTKSYMSPRLGDLAKQVHISMCRPVQTAVMSWQAHSVASSTNLMSV
jgi:hypothetical protein